VYQQAKCKRIKEGSLISPVDDGGHLIGTQFGGTGDQINYVPMPQSVNRSGGAWYRMEDAWADYLTEQGTNPRIRNLVITINYTGSSKKPNSFIVTWKQFDIETNKFVNQSATINN